MKYPCVYHPRSVVYTCSAQVVHPYTPVFDAGIWYAQREAIRNEERMERLKRKYKEALQFIADEIEEWNGKFKACENMPTKTMTQQMKRDTVKLHLRKDYEEVTDALHT